MLQSIVLARRLWPALLALALGGCASPSGDAGFAAVAADVRQRTGAQARWAQSEGDSQIVDALVRKTLTQPLSADDAVQIALVNNPGLQASYAELGIGEADLLRASRLPNPRFSFSRISNRLSVEIERKFALDVVAVLLMPVTMELEANRFKATQTGVVDDALRVALETRRTYFLAVSAAESVRYYEQVLSAAAASAELARRMAEAGNWSQLAQARETIFRADAVAQVARAKQNAATERERLARLLGLGSDSSVIQLPARLPDPPAAPRNLATIDAQMLARRLDIQMARQGLETTGYALGLTKATRFIGVFDLAYRNKSDTGVPRQNGYDIDIEIPLFDWGDAKVAKAEAIYLQSAARLAEVTGNAQSDARLAYGAYRTNYELARHHREEIVPLRKKIADETLLRYNGMLLSVFELLADAREQVMSVNAAIEATRDFWLADANLDAAVAGLPVMPFVGATAPGATASAMRSAH